MYCTENSVKECCLYNVIRSTVYSVCGMLIYFTQYRLKVERLMIAIHRWCKIIYYFTLWIYRNFTFATKPIWVRRRMDILAKFILSKPVISLTVSEVNIVRNLHFITQNCIHDSSEYSLHSIAYRVHCHGNIRCRILNWHSLLWTSIENP